MKDITTVEIQLDQFEAMRLCDVEGMDQTEAGQSMGISRGTVQRLLYLGRNQLMEAIMHNSAIIIILKNSETENVSMCTDNQRGRIRRRRS